MTEFIPTKASRIKDTEVDFQSAVYESRPKSKSKVQEENDLNDKQKETRKKTSDTENPGVNLKRLKYEVMKFGISGFLPKDAKEAKIQLAIKLGAKPPKNKNKNYKLLIQERKKERQKEELEQKNFAARTNLKQKPAGKKQQKKGARSVVKGHIADVYGKVDRNKIKPTK